MTNDLDTWAACTQAVAALIALGAAVWAGITAKKSLDATNKTVRIEQARDEQRAEQARRAQASRVVVLPARGTETVPFGSPHEAREASGPVPAVEILNRSDLPIYDVTVTAPGEPTRVGLVRPDSSVLALLPYDALAEDHSGITDPGLRAVAQRLSGIDHYEGSRHTEILNIWQHAGRCAITFTDAAQNRWTRNLDGTLTAQ